MKITNSVEEISSSKIGQSGNGEDSVIKGIKNQIANAEKQLKSLAENKDMSIDEKKEKQKEILANIADLNKQIASHQLEIKQKNQEKIKAKMQKEAEKNAFIDKKQESVISKESMTALVKASSSMSEAKAINHVKTHMSGEAHGLQGAIAMEESRGGNPIELKSKLEKVEENIAKTTSNIISKYGEANKAMKQANEMEKEKNKTENDSKKDKIYDKEDSINANTKDNIMSNIEELKTENNVGIDEKVHGKHNNKQHLDMKL